MHELYLLHGRMSPDESPDGWGFSGPRLQGVKGLHFTYMTYYNVHFVDDEHANRAHEVTGWPYFEERALTIKFKEDLVVIEPTGSAKQYFGDWGTMPVESAKELEFCPAVCTTSKAELVDLAIKNGYSREDAEQAVSYVASTDYFIDKTGKYHVSVDKQPPNGFQQQMVHLSIRRTDREPIHDWRELQEIKNAFLGKECEAIELYPAESRLVDSVNQFHLWGFVDENIRVPIGFWQRLVDDTPVGNAKNRPFEEGKPRDG